MWWAVAILKRPAQSRVQLPNFGVMAGHQRTTIIDPLPVCGHELEPSSFPGLPPPPMMPSQLGLREKMMMMIVMGMKIGRKQHNACSWVYCYKWWWLRHGQTHSLGPHRFHRGSRQLRHASSVMLAASGYQGLVPPRSALTCLPARHCPLLLILVSSATGVLFGFISEFPFS